MKIVFFCHSLLSDWNHGNAHFLRGLATELVRGGHDVQAFEADNAWSAENLLTEQGTHALFRTQRHYPLLTINRYEESTFDPDEALCDADLVIVHEWTTPTLVNRIGRHRSKTGRYRLLFHDTHHRAITAAHEIDACDLSRFDGILAFGEVLREVYAKRGWGTRVWTFHEAADATLFRPHPEIERERDLVWIGNWGDDERTREIEEFIIDPVAELGLSARMFGVRYPDEAMTMLAAAGIEYLGWLPNYEVPTTFARSRVTVHVPRRPYVEALRGIPTIRPFEALACGIPLVSSPWDDCEGLFVPGADYLVAHNGDEMTRHLRVLLEDEERARELAEHGRATILSRHTCAHRANQLMSICRSIGIEEHTTLFGAATSELGGAP